MFILYETIQQRVDRFLQLEKPIGIIIDPEQVQALAVAALKEYAGHGNMVHHIEQHEAYLSALEQDSSAPAPTPTPLDADFPITGGEWSRIDRLFKLLVEEAQAQQLEATRVMGADVFGRSTSEVAAELQQYRSELPQLAFYQPPVLII